MSRPCSSSFTSVREKQKPLMKLQPSLGQDPGRWRLGAEKFARWTTRLHVEHLLSPMHTNGCTSKVEHLSSSVTKSSFGRLGVENHSQFIF